MHIREIVLDGFKSYAMRTVIGPFDSHFSAITGLNGSGKSNILDAICFVLGITTLASVRVNNLQELIYRNGQAGVTKANVTLFFDNTDKTRCPLEYQQCSEISVRREISLGGETKYTINGTRATGERVKGFFQSVGLNVNNPNFLIMQGRITQVIHMKPDELLSLVSETSGINTYETGKRKAVSKLNKKQALLKQIQDYFDRDLVPKLDRARKEKEEYDAWARENDKLQVLEQRLNCRRYIDLETEARGLPDLLRDLANKLKTVDMEANHCEAAIRTHNEAVGKLTKRKSGNSQETKSEEDALQGLKKDFTALKTVLNGYKEDLKLLGKERKKLENELAAGKERRLKLEQDTKGVELEETSASDKHRNLTEEVTDLQTKLAAAKAGTSVDPVRELEHRIAMKNQEVDRKDHEIVQITQQLDQCAEDISKKEENLVRTKANSREQVSTADLRTEIQQLEEMLEKYRGGPGDGLDGGDKARLEQELRAERTDLNRLGSKYTLDYTDPEPNFDRSKVKGRVIRLIEMRDKTFARALEAGAGGGLFSVVVDTDLTAQVMLNRKTLGNVRYLPLNRMQAKTIPQHKIDRIKQEYGEQVHFALSLVKYRKEYQKSIEHVLGNFFVCTNGAVAKKIAFELKERVATLDGNLYDPWGSISGGYFDPADSDLEKVDQVIQKEKRIADITTRLNELDERQRRASATRNEVNNLQAQLEAKKRQLANREELENTSYAAKIAADLVELKQKKGNLQVRLDHLKTETAEVREEIKEMERERRESKGRRGSLQGEFQAKLARAQEKLEQTIGRLRKAKKDLAEKNAELASLDEELRGQAEELAQLTDKNAKLTADIEKAKVSVEETNARLDRKQKEVDEKKRQDSMFYEEIQELQGKIEEFKKENEQRGKQKAYLLEQHQNSEAHQGKIKEDLRELRHKHPYVVESPFSREDLDTLDPFMAVKELEMMRGEIDRKGSKVNKRVGGTLEDLKKDFDKVAEEKKVVEADSREIERVIKTLDDQKEMDLQRTCVAVDENLKEIFSSLLPGADASLQRAIAGKDREGLEFKVSFSGVTKTNLNELSGGQRSLLALSFILALLKCKPAPIYIFDEIDAALDLSHTQNIGSMVRRHFAESQFVVVSLKEGMFSNASILFRTQFLEGRSVVERHELASRDKEGRARAAK